MLEEVKFNDLERKVFSVLSKEGTCKILDSASSKMESRRGKWNDLGLTKRQYYTRIRALKDTHMIKKVGEKYVLTEFGEKIYNIIGNLKNYTSSPKKLKMLSETVGTDLFSKDNSIFPMEDWAQDTECLEVFYSRDALVEGLVKHIETAEEVMYVATNYTDKKVVKALLKTDRDLTIRAIGAGVGPEAAIERLRAVSSLSDLRRLIDLASNLSRVSFELPYSFALKDHEYVGLEIPDPNNSNEFFLGLTLKGRRLYEYFLSKFSKIYEESGESSLPIKK